jgi:hypothetical protein
MNPFPSMKAKRLLAVLERQPLDYELVRQSGSHRRMRSPVHPPLRRKRGNYSDVEDRMETVRVIYHHETDGWWAESPDVEGWAGEGIPFALERDDVALEHFVPAGESVAA